MRHVLNQLTLTERALTLSALVSAALLAGAHFFETFGGLVPCILCLDQREAHWTGLAVSTAGMVISKIFKSKIGATAAVGAVALVYLVSAGLAFYHTGVEYGYWPGPAICSGGGLDGVDVNDLAASLGERANAPSCEDVQWRFLGVSMAGYNLLASAGLFAFTLFAALAETRLTRSARGTKSA
jgi:disulfide bond formation protein DsbB